jgi:hypothetical protein
VKKLIAILLVLTTLFSFAACSESAKENAEKDEATVDSVDKNENKNDNNDEAEKETEPVALPVPTFTEDRKQNQQLLEAYLASVMDMNEYDKVNESDSSSYTSKTYGIDGVYYKNSNIDFEIVVEGNQISFPTNLATLESLGFDFANSGYNSDSERKANTYGEISMKGASDKGFSASFLNNTDANLKLSECIVHSIEFEPYYNEFSDFSVNGLTVDSSFEDILEEFGTPGYMSCNYYDTGSVNVLLYYYNYTDGKMDADEELFINYNFTDGEISAVSYEIPIYNFS